LTTTSTVLSGSTPYEDSFESYTVGTPINGAASWCSTPDDYSLVATGTPVITSVPFPIPDVTHTNVLRLNTECAILTNAILDVAADLYVDMLLKATLSEALPAYAQAMDNLLTSMVVDYNGNLWVFAAKEQSSTTWTNEWVQLKGSLPIDPNATTETAWFRITVQTAFAATSTNSYFRVLTNGISATSPEGRVSPSTPSTDGCWLPCVNQSALTFGGVAFLGTGYVDDLVIVGDQPSFGEPTSCTVNICALTNEPRQIELSWLSDRGTYYQLETTNALGTGAWCPLGSRVVGYGSTNRAYAVSGSRSNGFYRVLSSWK
jgi:hypothetical protein